MKIRLAKKIMKKLMVVFLILGTIAFSFCTPQGANGEDKVQKEDSIVWKEEICPECKGVGQVKASTFTRVYLGIISFGPGAMVQTEECDFCHGSGVILKRVLPHHQGNKFNKQKEET